jgi:hypothetical protein
MMARKRRKRRRYVTVIDGERFALPRNEWIACCDCGKVHRWRFEIVDRGRRRFLVARVWADRRATAAVRRGL